MSGVEPIENTTSRPLTLHQGNRAIKAYTILEAELDSIENYTKEEPIQKSLAFAFGGAFLSWLVSSGFPANTQEATIVLLVLAACIGCALWSRYSKSKVKSAIAAIRGQTRGHPANGKKERS